MQVTVLAMGGRITPTDECLKVFLHLAGGDAARILILPTACHNVLAVQEYARGLEMLGVRYPPTILPVWEREQAEDRSLVRVLACVSAVLILGGDLNRLLAVVRGTRLHHALWQAGAAGVVIGGISAGAAALGTWVGGLEGALRPSRWQPALGVLPHTVIVPHFHRQGRLVESCPQICYNIIIKVHCQQREGRFSDICLARGEMPIAMDITKASRKPWPCRPLQASTVEPFETSNLASCRCDGAVIYRTRNAEREPSGYLWRVWTVCSDGVGRAKRSSR